MSIELQHPSVGTLELRRAQQDERNEDTQPEIFNDPAVDSPPLVLVAERTGSYTMEGTVTAPKLSQDSAFSDDWRQALAEWIVKFESFCYELQGAGYDLVDTHRNKTVPVVLNRTQWRLTAGAPYEIEWEIEVDVGEGVLPQEPRTEKTANIQSAMTVPASVGGFDLPGLRDMTVQREFDVDPNARAFEDTAESNIIIGDSGVMHQIRYRGEFAGTATERQTFDSDINSLIGDEGRTFQTRFPGYSVDGVVLNFRSDFQAQFAGNKHNYELEFLESEPA